MTAPGTRLDMAKECSLREVLPVIILWGFQLRGRDISITGRPRPAGRRIQNVIYHFHQMVLN